MVTTCNLYLVNLMVIHLMMAIGTAGISVTKQHVHMTFYFTMTCLVTETPAPITVVK